jgi:hypothetical protein
MDLQDDLKGKVPKANTLEEANKMIKALWDIIQQLNEKIKTNSKNSSLALSKDRSLKNKSNVKRPEERKKIPRNKVASQGI